ncbi:hypothetical protein V6N13_057055 [Hibiscus sabdariffa]|uniref:Uncharacterized protein n=1 Tax=Hibiscus sabdariffa TaxID=183260 RepID=A0ABR2D2S8_9ROSI
MADEVTGLLENLKFSEEELVDVSNVDDEVLTEMEGSERWVVGLMSQQTGERIVPTMGTHKAVDLRPGEGRLREYLRVRTEIDSSKPLRRFIALGKLMDGRLRMCPVKYDRLISLVHSNSENGIKWT